MAYDIGLGCMTGNFDLYCVFVELTFGSLLSAMLGVLLIMYLVGAITRTNPATTTILSLLFIGFYMTLWWGGIYAFFIFIAALGWFTLNVWWLIRSRVGTT